MRPSQILAAVVAMSSVTHAIDAFDNIHGLTDVKNVLFGRQNDSTSDTRNWLGSDTNMALQTTMITTTITTTTTLPQTHHQTHGRHEPLRRRLRQRRVTTTTTTTKAMTTHRLQRRPAQTLARSRAARLPRSLPSPQASTPDCLPVVLPWSPRMLLPAHSTTRSATG